MLFAWRRWTIWLCDCLLVHTTLGSRLFCRNGMRAWVRTYTPRVVEKNLKPRDSNINVNSLHSNMLPTRMRSHPLCWWRSSSPAPLHSLLSCASYTLRCLSVAETWQNSRLVCKERFERNIAGVGQAMPTSTCRDGYWFLKASANSQTLRVSDKSTIWTYTS